MARELTTCTKCGAAALGEWHVGTRRIARCGRHAAKTRGAHFVTYAESARRASLARAENERFLTEMRLTGEMTVYGPTAEQIAEVER
jgi:hypothetical protein